MAKFKTRARAIDMLGRQQIAGIPNAISELFKNAHDAYADAVVVDFFNADKLFVLRDDGLGMTKEDFENRWLTIGTESKIPSSKGIALPPTDENKPKREITGEKGIGRLAIAVIGPQVLVLTKAKRKEGINNLVASFIHWGLFEQPGLNLDEIDIPIEEYPSGTLPNNEEINNLINVVRSNVKKLLIEKKIDIDNSNKILKDLDIMTFDFEELFATLGNPSLENSGHGTHFIVFPTNESLSADIKNDLSDKNFSKSRKLLLGFNNTMIPNCPEPMMKTIFRFWETNDSYEDIINEREFFTPGDFTSADHRIEGKFDEFGQFMGNITVYGKTTKNHVISWPNNNNFEISCGRFSINVAYLPGTNRESKLSPEEWALLSRKLDKIGGLYIYQDGIRILPYGDSDVDWLNIEKRRSLGAGYYFFSYRRMFGAIELTRMHNKTLAEKAGREGFQENKAYREFRSILENFFIQIAADFFRKEGEQSEEWKSIKEELNKKSKALKQQQVESKNIKAELSKKFDTFFYNIEENKPQQEIDILLNNLQVQINNVFSKLIKDELYFTENNIKKKLDDIRNSYNITIPKNIGLTKQLQRELIIYRQEYHRINEEIFKVAEIEIDQLLSSAYQREKKYLEQKNRIEFIVNDLFNETNKSLNEKLIETTIITKEFNNNINQIQNDITTFFNDSKREFSSKLLENNFNFENNNAYHEILNHWKVKLLSFSGKYTQILDSIILQTQNINWFSDIKDTYSNNEIIGAMEEELIALQERVDLDLELTQLGMAVDIINHEFSNTIKAIRNNLRLFKSWAELNPPLIPIYTDINDSFTHLDGYLSLFTPLNRRIYRSAVEIHGSNIANYLSDLFRERLERHEVKLSTTKSFRDMKVIGYPSTFYPVFINLIDNAIFWLKEHSLPRKINLDAKGNSFIVSDNGPGIPLRDQNAIFELGFSRKPGGRGMGLYISQEVLKKENYQLVLENNSKEVGATFIIQPMIDDDI